jgi:hypothetical protein
MKILIPGLAQIAWGQSDRGLVLLVSFATAIVTTLFCWGNPLSWGFFAFAFATHLLSTIDVLRQRAFPTFPTGLALVSLMTTGLLVYAPIATILWLCAFPASADGTPGVGFLVNSLAYPSGLPTPGQWICLRPSAASAVRVGQVVATAGQEVEWTGRVWQVDGKDLTLVHPGLLPYYPNGWRFRVPARHVLIGAQPPPKQKNSEPPLQIVAQDQIVGRVWARYYPFWNRCLL